MFHVIGILCSVVFLLTLMDVKSSRANSFMAPPRPKDIQAPTPQSLWKLHQESKIQPCPNCGHNRSGEGS